MHHFIAISEFKLELQCGNAKFWSNWWFSVSHDLEIWQMTLKNNMAHLPGYFKLCASFQSHWWIKTGVTVRKRPIWVKIDDFLSGLTLKCDGWPRKLIGHLSQHQALCIISSSYVNSSWSYVPETATLGFDLCDLDLWPLTLIFCMDIIFVIGNNSWKFHDDAMVGIWSKGCDRQTDRRTDGQTDRRTEPFIELLGRS